MGTIANLKVQLTAGIGGFAANMNKAGKSVTGLGNDVAASATKIAAWGGGLAALATGGGLSILVAKQLEAIDANAKLSDRLNVSTEALAAMQLAGDLAGVSSEALAGALSKMQIAIAGAGEDGTATAEAFKQLGLSGDSLANLTADQQFAKIADALGKVTNATERANLERQVFGKTGQSLDALIRSGSAGMADAADKTSKFGLAISRIDAAQVEAANDAMTAASKIIEGVGTQLAVKLAPFIEEAANRLIALGTTGRGAAGLVTDGFEMVVAGVAKSADYLELVEAGFQGMRVIAGTALSAIAVLIDDLGEGVVALLNLLPGVNLEWTKSFETLTAAIRDETAAALDSMNEHLQAFESGGNSTAAAKFFEDIRAKADENAKKIAADGAKNNAGLRSLGLDEDAMKEAERHAKTIADTIKALQTQIDQAGLSDTQKKLDDLIKLGASPADLEKAEGLLKTIEKQSATQKLSEKAQSLVDSIKTPIEIYNDKLAEIQQMLDQHLLTQGEFDKLKDKFGMDAAGGPSERPQLMEVGSAAAQRFAFEQSRGLSSMNDDVPKKQLSTQQDMARYLQEMTRNIGDIARNGTDITVIDSF